MSEITSFSFFEDPEELFSLNNSSNEIDTTVDATWTDFFRSETFETLATPTMDRDASSTPDSGIEVFNFDIENAFMGDNDPIMRQDEFEDEVNFLFNNKPTTSTVGLCLDFDITDIDNNFLDRDDIIEVSSCDSDTPTRANAFIGSQGSASLDNVTVNPQDEKEENKVSSEVVSKELFSVSHAVKIEDSVTSNIHSYSAKPKTASSTLRAHLRNNRGRSKKSTAASRKRKLYELDAPLPTPELEKCRLNAINAKKNRDLKKQQLELASTEIKRLRRENVELRDEVDNAREEMEELRAEMTAMREEFKMAGMSVGKRRKVC